MKQLNLGFEELELLVNLLEKYLQEVEGFHNRRFALIVKSKIDEAMVS